MIKYIIILTFCFSCELYSQNGSVYETYKQPNYQGDSNISTIFNKPIQEYNYIKTQRGIEVYRTYQHTNPINSSTNIYYQSRSSIFSRPEPDLIIKNNGQIYRTYNYGTNGSSIFARPFQSKVIYKNNKDKISFDGETLTDHSATESKGEE
jgi:hypothetical protein